MLAPLSIADIKREVLLPLMRGDGCIPLYAEEAYSSTEIDAPKAQFDALFTRAPVTRLFDALSDLTAALAKTDPDNIIEMQSRPSVLPVAVLEVKIKYQDGCKAFDALYESTQAQVGSVRRMAGLYELLGRAQQAEIDRLQVFIQAGQEFLEMYAPSRGSALERLEVRIQELISRLAAMTQSHSRAVLAVTGCAELLDLFDRLPEGLVSKWLAERQTPMAGYQVEPDAIARAVAAYDELRQAMDALTSCATKARDQERAVAVARAQQIAADCGLVEADVFRLRNGEWELRRESRAERYTDPISGVSWKTKEQTPEWLEGVDLEKYLVVR